MAPEVLQKNYDQKCDVWSLGVIMYILFCGYPPFNGSTDDKIMERILTQEVLFPPEEWASVSKEAKELIRDMLNKNPLERPSAKQLLDHHWFLSSRASENNVLQKKIVKNLSAFVNKNKLQTALRYYMVNFMDLKQEKRELVEAFQLIDQDNNGLITRAELTDFIHKNRKFFHNIEPDQILDEMDLDGSKNIDYNEFLLMMFNFKKHLNEDLIKTMFDLIDANKDGSISADELGNFFHFNPEQEEFLKELMLQADQNGDGMISYSEFKSVLLR